ncbi:MAG: bifunctional riboflavin kinase/FAD synthetase [Clostridiales bacterium]|nr:bifunctional riboflavin kinase/FAD synthetase [Clostridiales bacterium]
MKYFSVLVDTVDTESKVVVMGNFDGVHLGHRELLRTAKKFHENITVLTFVNHTSEVLSGEKKQNYLLSLFDERMNLFSENDVCCVAGCYFDEAIMGMSPIQYVEWFMVHFPNVEAVVVGYNYRFAKHASADAKDLKNLLSAYGVKTEIVDEFKLNGIETVSSTIIRNTIEAGNITKANEMLGRNYKLSGNVVSGYARGGNLLGFPTANIDVSPKKIVPNGVFAGYTYVNGKKHVSVANIGNNPTFNNKKRSVEVFIIDFNENIYGNTVEFEFVCKIREEIKFESFTQLSEQIRKDVDFARKACAL